MSTERTGIAENDARARIAEAGRQLIEIGQQITDLSQDPGLGGTPNQELSCAIEELSGRITAFGQACDLLRKALAESVAKVLEGSD